MYDEYDSVRFFLRLPAPLAPLGFFTDFFAGCFFAGGMTLFVWWRSESASSPLPGRANPAAERRPPVACADAIGGRAARRREPG